MFDYPLLFLFPAAMIYAAAMDFFTMTIPNRASIALVLGFVAAALLAGMGWQTILSHLGIGCVVLLLTIFMFAQGWMGGGDAKLLSATVIWFGWPGAMEYTLMAAIGGGLLTLLILSFRFTVPPIIVAGRDWAERLHNRDSGVPYGIALGGTGLLLFPYSPVFIAYSL